MHTIKNTTHDKRNIISNINKIIYYVNKLKGHVGGFSDPMVDCKETKKRYRADQLFAAPILLTESNEEVGWICVQEAADDDMQSKANKQAKRILKSQGRKGETFQRPFELKDLTILPPEIVETKVPNPDSNDGKATLTAPRDFELMFKTSVGAATDASSVAYLRPETAQGIFLNHRNVVDTCRTVVRCSLFVVCWLLFVGCCSLFVNSLFVGRCSSFVVR